MSQQHEGGTEMNLRHEAILDRFEQAWRRGDCPAIADYLEGEGAGRQALLAKLAAADLEGRRRRGWPACAELYLACWPELAADRSTRVELVRLEWHLRGGADTDRTREMLRQRFPDLAEEVARLPAPARAETVPNLEQTLPALPGPTEGPWPAPPGYEVLRELGKGGMGVVYLARQIKADRLVALKMILGEALHDRVFVARFHREARAMAQVRHPHVAQVYDVVEHAGQPFFSMEYCSGGTLEKKLGGKPLPAREAAEVVLALAEGMEAAHRQGVIHRDLKPANVLLGEDGALKVADFGLAKRFEPGGSLTRPGQVMGTPAYMAPERAVGKKEVGPATDVYALGAILYECMTGRPPFKAATVGETLAEVIREQPLPPRTIEPGVPRDLEAVCLKCLDKAPERRYPSAAALADDLGRWLKGLPVRARTTGTLGRLALWFSRRPMMAVALCCAVVSLVAGSVGLLVLERRASRKEREATVALAEVERTLAEGLIRPLGNEKTWLRPHEVLTLEELASLPAGRERVRRLFLEEGTRRAGAARRLEWRLEEASHAAIGLSPTRRAHAEQLIRARLIDPDTPPAGRRVSARLVAVLVLPDRELVEQAARALLEPGCERCLVRDPGPPQAIPDVEEAVAITPAEVDDCRRAFRLLAGRLDRARREALAGTILHLALEETQGQRLEYLTAGYAALRPVPGEGTRRLARRLMALAAGEEGEEREWLVRGWTWVAPLGPADVAQAQAARLLARIDSLLRAGEPAFGDVQGVLPLLAPWLDETQAERLLVASLDRNLQELRHGEVDGGPDPADQALASRLGPAQATRLARRVLGDLGRGENALLRDDLAFLLWRLCMTVEPAAAPELMDGVMGLTVEADDKPIVLSLPGLDRLAAHLSPGQLRRLVGRLVRRLDGPLDRFPGQALAALAHLLGRLPTPEARQVAGWFAGWLLANAAPCKADRPHLGVLARCHAAVRSWLPQERTRKEEALLWSRTQQAGRVEDHFDEEWYVRLLVRFAPADVPATALALVRAAAIDRGPGDRSSALTLLAKHLSLEQMVEMLRQPTCVGTAREVLLAELGRRKGRTFTDLWQLVEYLQDNARHIDLDAPAPRGPRAALD
jgi:hypothetical protein